MDGDSMNISYISSRRIILACAVLLVSVIGLISLRVIPAVESDSYPGANPERAVPAFWMNVGLCFITAIIVTFIAITSKGRSRITTISLILVGVVVLLLGLALVDAASAFRSHGPSMQSVSIALFICAAVDIFVGVTIGVMAILRPKRIKRV
jgi:hypothetical protein